MSEKLGQLAVVHWALIAGNTAYSLGRMYEDLRDPELHSIVFELREIQAHLNVLDSWFRDERILRLLPSEVRDIETAIGSCTRSLAKLEKTVKDITALKRGQPTQLIWGEIKTRFQEVEGQLLDQLQVHRVFLTKLFPVLRLHFIFSKPQNRAEMDRVHQQVQAVNGMTDPSLYEQRLRQWEEYHRRVQEQARRNPQPPSPDYNTPAGFVPIRGHSTFHHSGPNAYYPSYDGVRTSHRTGAPPSSGHHSFYHPYPSPPTSTSSNPSASPQQPHPSSRSRQRRSSMPPAPTAPSTPAPPQYPIYEAPQKPSRTLSRSRHSSRESLRAPSPTPHGRLRERARTPSPSPYGRLRERSPSRGSYGRLREDVRLPGSGPHGRMPLRRQSFTRPGNEGSRCFGQHIEQLVFHTAEKRVLDAECDNDLEVALWRNEETGAARVVCTIDSVGSWVNDSSRHTVRFQSSMKLAFLAIKRQGRTLYLIRRKQPWAQLCFDDFENMAFFFHSFLALRTWGPEPPEIESHEKWLAGEVPVFNALIDDNGNYNRLYILRDGETKKIRIASMLQDERNEDLIIWTAFLQDYIEDPNWMKRSSFKIIFEKLSVSHFGSYGDFFILGKPYNNFTLTFLNTNDSVRFEDTIIDLSLE